MYRISTVEIIEEPMIRFPIDINNLCDHQIGLIGSYLIPASSSYKTQYMNNPNVEWFKYCPKCGQSLHNINGLEVKCNA